MRIPCRAVAWFILAVVMMILGCQGEPPAEPEKAPKAQAEGKIQVTPTAEAAPRRNEIPPPEMTAVVNAHLKGLGHMERYEYDKAIEAFREVNKRAPDWIPGTINLAIGLLNKTGNQNESAKQGRGGPSSGRSSHDEALHLLDEVLEREPENLHAHYSRAIILEDSGKIAEAHADYKFVAERDPNDPHALFKVGSTLVDPENPDRPAGPKQAKQLVEIYSKALERNPYLVTTLYKLQAAYGWSGDRAKQGELLKSWKVLNPEQTVVGTGELAKNTYGEMGRYATIINPVELTSVKPESGPAPRFEVPKALDVALPEGHRWVNDADFQGPNALIGRVRSRFGAAVASFDADGDGRYDLYLTAAVVGPKGIRDALLLNKGDGKFEDASQAYALPEDRASLGVAAGDFDADRRIDLFVTGATSSRLLRNAGKAFEDITRTSGLDVSGLSLTARWVDLDQDGDLDLYVVNYTTAELADQAFGEKPVTGLANRAYRNDGKPAPMADRPADNWAPLATASEDLKVTAGLSIAFTPWPDAEALTGGANLHTAVAVLDIDDDRDLDLVLTADGLPAQAVLNDRLGRFHTAEIAGLELKEPVSGLLVTDLDKDGLPDLAATSAKERVVLWRNKFDRSSENRPIFGESWPTNATAWTVAMTTDLDLDTWPDLVGITRGKDDFAPAWAHNDGKRLESSALALGPDPAMKSPLVGFSLGDLIGDPLPDLLLVSGGEVPRISRNLGNGNHWLSIDLSGRWKIRPEQMRTNSHGIGTRLTLEGQGLHVPFSNTTLEAGLAQSIQPIVLGLGKVQEAALLRLRWPDGTMQSELNIVGDKRLTLAEHNRKTGSCPVLFTWNGERFVCLGDFLGGGGLGYLVAPGLYGQPDRDESVAIAADQLKAEQGTFRLSITEPMDEVAYIDKLVLDVVDNPPGIKSTPDERFAPEGPRPTGELIAWRQNIEPEKATDLEGRDMTETLKAWDRRTVDTFKRRNRWIGYAEDHGIILDFSDRLSRFDPKAPLVLCLAGWVEYPYSQTNYAAATAGVTLTPPSIERRRDDGTWELIEPHAGYPAGLPRMTTLDLTGKLTGGKCVLRLRTNMECYWDQAFVALREKEASIRVSSLMASRAVLGDRGYTREASPDGRLPLLYDYDHIDPAPLARMAGSLTRYGDVVRLLNADDDQFCIVGPGDEIRLEFDAKVLPDLPEGWTRSYVLRSFGYCKDADPFTATSDSIEPMPWKGMPAYPFGLEGERPRDPDYDRYLKEYQTRPGA
ncbi:FG-GAP-like repeat-containing protein [Singulisphaera sp. PoT]|uniref:FG-GAP-like repeat-containing protein n=1 Tax=Singulisphaera sp. PoT TaxID=3411797 RepID=UPI003BF4B8EA